MVELEFQPVDMGPVGRVPLPEGLDVVLPGIDHGSEPLAALDRVTPGSRVLVFEVRGIISVLDCRDWVWLSDRVREVGCAPDVLFRNREDDHEIGTLVFVGGLEVVRFLELVGSEEVSSSVFVARLLVLVYGGVLERSLAVSAEDVKGDWDRLCVLDVVSGSSVVVISGYVPEAGCPIDADVSPPVVQVSEYSTVKESSLDVATDELLVVVIASELEIMQSHYLASAYPQHQPG